MRITKKQDRMPGIILTILLFVAEIAFTVLLLYTNLLSAKYIGIVFAVLLVLLLIDHLLIRKFRKQIRFWIGIILMVIILPFLELQVFIFIKQYLHLMILQVLIKKSQKSMYMSNRMMQPRALWMQPVIHLVFWQISIEKTQTLHYSRWQVRPVGK